MGRLSSQDCGGNKRPPADGRNLGVSPHIFAHKHSGLQNGDARGDPNVSSVEEHVLGCIFSTPTLEHALVAFRNHMILMFFRTKKSTKIEQRTWNVSLKSQLDAAEIFLASNRAVNRKKEQRDTGREKAKRWSQETESEFN